MSAQLCAWRQNIAVISHLADTDSAERAALRKHSEEIPCRDVHLARCLQFAMHKFRLSLFVKDLEPGGSITFCFLIV